MSHDIAKLQKEYYALLDKQIFDTESLDYSVLNKYLPFFEQLNDYNHSAVSVFDLSKKKHIYLSSNYYSFFELSVNQQDDHDEHSQRVHPDDYILMLKMGIEGFSEMFSLPAFIKKDFRVVNEYRLRQNGNYIRVIEHLNVLELDANDNLWLTLNIINRMNDTTIDAPFRSTWQNLRTGEMKEWKANNDILSEREKQILDLIYKGYASKQIADKLYISINTVNNHRQNIISKLGVANTVEAIRHLNRAHRL